MRTRRSSILPILAALALAVPAAVQAQSAVGIVGGANFATFSGDDADDAGHRTGLVVGAFAAFPLGNVLTFRPEVVYTQKGATFEEAGVEGGLQLDYIEIPVLLRIGVPGVGLGLHALAGPTLAFEVGCSADIEGGGLELSADCDDADEGDEAGPERKSFLVGGQVGAGVDLPLAMAILSLDGRYTFDLEGLFDEEDAADFSNRVWSVTASVGFPLGR